MINKKIDERRTSSINKRRTILGLNKCIYTTLCIKPKAESPTIKNCPKFKTCQSLKHLIAKM